MKKLLIALGGALLLSAPAMAHNNHGHHHRGRHNHCHAHPKKGFSHCHGHEHRGNGRGHHGNAWMHPVTPTYIGPLPSWQIYLDF